jgi:DNA-binding MarR family transcriptional regulator
MAHFKAMAAIDKQGALTMGEVANVLKVTLGGATSFVDRLVSAGYATREYDPRDRRVVRVRLTPKGRETTYRIIGYMVAYTERALSAIYPEERRKFMEIFRTIVANAEERPAGPSP